MAKKVTKQKPIDSISNTASADKKSKKGSKSLTAPSSTSSRSQAIHEIAGVFINRFALILSLAAVILSFVALTLAVFNPDTFEQAKATGESVEITSITPNGSDYSVSFTLTGFVNDLTGLHTHFYFDTEANTVMNKMYYGQSPYSLETSSVPQGATQLCAIVAQVDHTVIPNSGNCVNLPVQAVPSVSLGTPTIGSSNITVPFTTENFTETDKPAFYFSNQQASDSVVYNGSSPYSFSITSIPQTANKICAVVKNSSNAVVSTAPSCSDIPVIETSKIATITSITEAGQDISVAFNTLGYSNSLTGAYTRFYYDNQGSNATGNEYYAAGPYLIPKSSVPTGATKLCVVVVENSAVITNSGNCVDLPTLTPSNPPSAQINTLAVSGSNLSVSFTVSNFSNNATTYTRFYFDNEANSVTNKNYTGASPYVIPLASVTQGATQLCVVVVNDNSVVANSGNCSNLPAGAINNTNTNTNNNNTNTNTNTNNNTTNTNTNTNTTTTTQTTAPFKLNATTNKLDALLAPSKASYTIGEALRFDVTGIKNANGTPASNVACNFTLTFTPANSTQAKVLQVTKNTDSSGNCTLGISTNGTIAKKSIPLQFEINADAQTAAVGSKTDIFNTDGTGTVTVSVTGSNNTVYTTNSANFTVGTVNAGDLARTGGISLVNLFSVMVGILLLIGMAVYVLYMNRKGFSAKKTKLK